MWIQSGKFLGIVVVFLVAAQYCLAAKRYALVVGIDKYPHSRKLEGSVNDANAVASFLKEKKFTEIRLLTETQSTRKAILESFDYFQAKVKTGDIFFFYFAGHGTLFSDERSEKEDETLKITSDINAETGKPDFPSGYYDSAICPIDHRNRTSNKRWGNIILDDELYVEFSEFVDRGSGVLFISDSCNSGTLGRSLNPPNARFLTPEEAYDLSATDQADNSVKKAPATAAVSEREMPLDNFLALTAAADQQNAEEFEDKDRKMWGVFTYYFLEILRENPNIAIPDLAVELDKRTAQKNPRQKSQIESRFFKGDIKRAKFLYPF